ncbi:MAG: LapA family protein [Rhodobacter sp.]|nr:LapA family protein [Rhodobacter sp.]
MRYIRYAILAAIAVCLVTVALANRGPVTLTLMPTEVSGLIGIPDLSITLPLFIVIFLGVVAGLLLGFVWEWLREHKHRAEAATQRREKERLVREVEKMKTASAETGDEVLALLDKAR